MKASRAWAEKYRDLVIVLKNAKIGGFDSADFSATTSTSSIFSPHRTCARPIFAGEMADGPERQMEYCLTLRIGAALLQPSAQCSEAANAANTYEEPLSAAPTREVAAGPWEGHTIDDTR